MNNAMPGRQLNDFSVNRDESQSLWCRSKTPRRHAGVDATFREEGNAAYPSDKAEC